MQVLSCVRVSMEESSSSGEESSEEKHDEASSSPRGPLSSTTAASEKTGLFNERGYLKSLSRQERRRIEQEIRKRRKLGEIDIQFV